MPLNVDQISTGTLRVNGIEIDKNTAHYELDITQTNVVTVNTTTGIIDILGMGTSGLLTPTPSFGTVVDIIIDNPGLNLTLANRDNVYVQYSLYYNRAVDDNAIPYLVSTGFISQGLNFELFNANPNVADPNNWTGALYVYFELYTIN
jgi:hypothetical protein